MAGKKSGKKATEKIDNLIYENQKCPTCGKKLSKYNTYQSSSSIYNYLNYVPFCKDCIWKKYEIYLRNFNDEKKAIYMTCRTYNIAFSEVQLDASFKENNKTKGVAKRFKVYMKNLNSFGIINGDEVEFVSSDILFKNNVKKEENKKIEIVEIDETEKIAFTEKDQQVKDMCTRKLGYDPFENENGIDKKKLYYQLSDYLDDETTLNDNFKVPAIIEIIKGFNQSDKINNAISSASKSEKEVLNNAGGIKALIDTKKTLLASVLGLAKDNGISANHNNNKSKGGGTLTGLIKEMHEKKIYESKINLYDVKTCEAMKQIADISNQSITQQLQLDENDYSEIVIEQREMIQDLTNKFETVQEEYRKAKIKLIELTPNGDDL